MDASSPQSEPQPGGADPPSVEGVDHLTRIFGTWPTFHDAEVVRLSLDRSGPEGPILEAHIHLFAMTPEVDARGYYVLRDHTLVTLRCTKVDHLVLEDFNHQNVLFSLGIEPLDAGASDGSCFRVRMESSYGVSAVFTCKRLIVIDAVPWIPRSD
jgi:hypothetical protein